jgi:hypothetical protein
MRATIFNRYKDPDVGDDTPAQPAHGSGPLVQISTGTEA